ncbi:hypothetical protein FRC02_005628 [Tulasnella sp. 418]|nr:hypothetical protein FRC02_005628 [Tulasnella sp. 418]
MLLFTTIVVFPPVVTTTFWLLLASPTTFRSPFTFWSNITFHALNSVFALSEIILSRMRPRWGHLPFLILTLGGFLGVAYLTLLTQGFVPYPFLEPSQGAAKLAIAIGGMTAANIGVFVVVWLLCFLRDKFLGRRAQGRGRYAQVNEMTAGVF